jgi:hemolysin activation/secretion protein
MLPRQQFFLTVTFAVLTSSVTLPVLAQRAPDTGTLLREIERSTGKTQVAPAPLLPVKPTAAGVPLPDQAGQSVFVSGFRIDADRFPAAELQEVLKSDTQRALTLAQLQAATRKISEYYRQHDYLAYAYLPPQTVQDGIVTIKVVEAKLGQVKRDTSVPSRLKDSIVLGTVTQRAVPGQPLRPGQLDQAIAALNEVPGVARADSVLQPGANPGESDAVVRMTDAPLAQGNMTLNNAGSEGTGVWQGSMAGSLDSPTGRGEQFQLSGLKSEGSRYVRLGASYPLGLSGRRVEINASALEYEVKPTVSPLELNGMSTTAGVLLTQPLQRSAKLSLTATAGFDTKRIVDRMDSVTLGDKQVRVGYLGLAALRRDDWLGGGFNTLNLTVNVGTLDLTRRSEQFEGDQLTAQTHGSYGKLHLTLSREQMLTSHVTLVPTLAAQWTPSNLDSSEKFSLGGFYGIHAYPTGEASGDNGWLFNLETRWQLRESLRLSGFYDFGWIQQHAEPWADWQTVANQPNSYHLQGVAVGLLWTPAPLFQAQAMIASVLGDNPGKDAAGRNSDGGDDQFRAWVQINFRF